MVALHYLSLDDTLLDVQVAYQLVDQMTAASMATIKYIVAINNFIQEAEYYLEKEADQPLPPGGGWAPRRGTLLDGWLNEAKNENALKDSFWRKVFILADKSVILDVIFGLIRQGRTKSSYNKSVDEEFNSWPEVWLTVLVKMVKKRIKVPVRISLGIAALDQNEKKQNVRKRKRGDNDENLPAGAEQEWENEGLPATKHLGSEPLQYKQPSSTSTQSSNSIRKLRIIVEICDHPYTQLQTSQYGDSPSADKQLPDPAQRSMVAVGSRVNDNPQAQLYHDGDLDEAGYERFKLSVAELNECLLHVLKPDRRCHVEKLGSSPESTVRVDPLGKRQGIFLKFRGQTAKNLAKRAVPAATSKDLQFSLPFTNICDHILELVERKEEEFDMVYCQGFATFVISPDYELVTFLMGYMKIKDYVKKARGPT